MIMRKIVFLLLSVVLFMNSSCSDDSLSSNDLFVYVRSLGNTSIESIMAPDESGAKDIVIKLPLLLTREATVDVRGTLQYDCVQVDNYNKLNETSYFSFPESAVNIQNSVTIPSGYLESKDSVQVSVSPVSLKSGDYLLPLMISNVESEDNGIRASSTSSLVLYKVKITIKYLSDNLKPVEGTVLSSDQWNISSIPENPDVQNVLDGDNSTYWSGERNVENVLLLDMGNEFNVRGINFHYEGTSSYICPNYMQVFMSDNNEDWINIGKSGPYQCSGYQNISETFGINFLIPLKMRYIKLIPEITYSFMGGPQINEIEIVE